MKVSQGGGFVLGMVAGLLIGLALALGVALYITKAPIPFIDKVPQRTAEHDRVEAERNKQWNPNAPLASKSGPPPAAAEPDTASSAAGVGVLPPVGLGSTAPSGAPAPVAKDPAAILAGAPVQPTKAGAQNPAAPAPGTTTSTTSTNSTTSSTTATSPRALPPAGAPDAATATTSTSAGARSSAPPLEAFVYFVQAGAYTRSDDAEQQRGRLALMGLTAKVTEREQSGRTVYRVRVGPYPARTEADALLLRLQEQAIEAQIVRVERP